GEDASGLTRGTMFTPGSRLDAVENRWRRLADLPRERRCTFRCSTDSVSTASAAVYRLTLITALAVAGREHAAARGRSPSPVATVRRVTTCLFIHIIWICGFDP